MERARAHIGFNFCSSVSLALFALDACMYAKERERERERERSGGMLGANSKARRARHLLAAPPSTCAGAGPLPGAARPGVAGRGHDEGRENERERESESERERDRESIASKGRALNAVFHAARCTIAYHGSLAWPLLSRSSPVRRAAKRRSCSRRPFEGTPVDRASPASHNAVTLSEPRTSRAPSDFRVREQPLRSTRYSGMRVETCLLIR